MTVICPKCKAENQLPDTLDRKTAYRCNVCKSKFTRISNVNFGEAAAWTLVAWLIVPALVWGSVPLIRGASEYSTEITLAELGFILALGIGIAAILMTIFHLKQGLMHKKFTRGSPQGFRRFRWISGLSPFICFAASGLAFAWWKWWA